MAARNLRGSKKNEESVLLSVSGGEVKYFIIFYPVPTSQGLIKKDMLYQGNGNETDVGSEMTAAVAPETPVVVTVVKEEAEQERKRKTFLRIQQQVATVDLEDEEVRFTFPEANSKDLSVGHNGQGFSFDKGKNVYFKRVKKGDLEGGGFAASKDTTYEIVSRMTCIPVVRTPSATPSSSPEKASGGHGSRSVHTFLASTDYHVKGHNMNSWSKYGSKESAQESKLVR